MDGRDSPLYPYYEHDYMGNTSIMGIPRETLFPTYNFDLSTIPASRESEFAPGVFSPTSGTWYGSLSGEHQLIKRARAGALGGAISETLAWPAKKIADWGWLAKGTLGNAVFGYQIADSLLGYATGGTGVGDYIEQGLAAAVGYDPNYTNTRLHMVASRDLMEMDISEALGEARQRSGTIARMGRTLGASSEDIEQLNLAYINIINANMGELVGDTKKFMESMKKVSEFTRHTVGTVAQKVNQARGYGRAIFSGLGFTGDMDPATIAASMSGVTMEYAGRFAMQYSAALGMTSKEAAGMVTHLARLMPSTHMPEELSPQFGSMFASPRVRAMLMGGSQGTVRQRISRGFAVMGRPGGMAMAEEVSEGAIGPGAFLNYFSQKIRSAQLSGQEMTAAQAIEDLAFETGDFNITSNRNAAALKEMFNEAAEINKYTAPHFLIGDKNLRKQFEGMLDAPLSSKEATALANKIAPLKDLKLQEIGKTIGGQGYDIVLSQAYNEMLSGFQSENAYERYTSAQLANQIRKLLYTGTIEKTASDRRVWDERVARAFDPARDAGSILSKAGLGAIGAGAAAWETIIPQWSDLSKQRKADWAKLADILKKHQLQGVSPDVRKLVDELDKLGKHIGNISRHVSERAAAAGL